MLNAVLTSFWWFIVKANIIFFRDIAPLDVYIYKPCYREASITTQMLPRQGRNVQYIPRNMHTVFALLCFVVVIHWLIFPYPSGLLHWHCGNLTIAPVPAKLPWWILINTSCEFIINDCITTTKQSTTKPCTYFLGYTVYCHKGAAVCITRLLQPDRVFFRFFFVFIFCLIHRICNGQAWTANTTFVHPWIS